MPVRKVSGENSRTRTIRKEKMDEVGFEDYVMGEGVSLIEWANLIEEILPQKRTEITIEKNLEEGFDYRKITVEETV